MEALDQLSTSELREALKKREKLEKEARELAKKEYEKNRDNIVNLLVDKAKNLSEALQKFKFECHEQMATQATNLSNYGLLRSNSKGGFQIVNTFDTMKVVRRRDTEPTWDERSQKATELIKDFLFTTIKKKDVKLYTILMGFLEKNLKGDLEYNKVMELLKHEKLYDDPRWIEGLMLIKESFSNNFKGFGYEFYFKTSEGKYEKIQINFSGL